MSKASSFLDKNSQIELGEYSVVASGLTTGTTSTINNSYLKEGTHLKTDYPDFYTNLVDSLPYDYDFNNVIPPTSSFLYGVAYGNGLYVAAGASGAIITSTDGLNWTVQSSGATNTFYGVTYGNEFVAVLQPGNGSGQGYSATSTNGVSWKYAGTPINSTATFNGIVLGAGVYVAAGTTGTIISSTDGITWTTRTSATTSIINDIAYSNTGGIFVTGGAGGLLQTSTDGVTWTARTSGTAVAINSVEFGNSLYVYGGVGGILASSTDAVTWDIIGPQTTTSFFSSVYGNGLYVAGGVSGLIKTSTDIKTWTTRTSGTVSSVFGLAYGNGLYVAVGSGGLILSSTDAITWTTRTSGTVSQLNAVAYGNGIYMTVGAGAVLTSTDAITWTTQTTGLASTVTFFTVTYGTTFVIAGNAGIVRTSTNGVSWSAPTSGTTSTIRTVIYENSLYLFAGVSGMARSSTDAVTWSTVTTGTTSVLLAAGYDSVNGVYALAGGVGAILTSTNAVSWTTRTVNGVNQINALTFNSGKGIAPGNAGVIQGSYDGVNWGSIGNITTTDIKSITYSNGIWFLGGGSNTTAGYLAVAVTNDAVLWVTRTTGNGDHNVVTYGNGLYVAGCVGGVIKTSTDSITWTTRTYGTATTVYDILFKDNVFYGAGLSAAIRTSTDGITWNAALAHIPTIAVTKLLHDGTRFYFSGGTGYIGGSDDGQLWGTVGLPSTVTPNFLNYTNGVYMTGGGAASSGWYATSTNKIIWSLRPIATTTGAYSSVYGNNLYVVGFYGGMIKTSTDAITWSTASPTTADMFGMAYGNGVYVGVGQLSNARAIVTSTDGITWSNAVFQAATSSTLYSVDYYNGSFIATGSTDILVSEDGYFWGSLPADVKGSVTTYRAITYGNNKVVGVGFQGAIAVSDSYNNSTHFFIPKASNNIVTFENLYPSSSPLATTYLRYK